MPAKFHVNPCCSNNDSILSVCFDENKETRQTGHGVRLDTIQFITCVLGRGRLLCLFLFCFTVFFFICLNWRLTRYGSSQIAWTESCTNTSSTDMQLTEWWFNIATELYPCAWTNRSCVRGGISGCGLITHFALRDVQLC